MDTVNRRGFLSKSKDVALIAAAGSSLVAPRAATARAPGPNDRIHIAFIGPGGRGRHLLHDFAQRDDCVVTHLCDVDQTVAQQRYDELAQVQTEGCQIVGDMRRVFDDPKVDAVVIATPDHWHALATIWACQAGKHVYVEKPISHTPWEGRQMVRAARKYDRVVQVGTQNRSAPYVHQAKEYIASGRLGTVHFVRVINQKELVQPTAVNATASPSTLDWDHWTGPAPMSEYSETYHRQWSHFWRFSGGDIANDAVHQLDIARWLLGLDYPTSVYCVGGRFATHGVSEMPDTQHAVYEFPNLVMSCELTLFTPYMIKSDAVLRNSDIFPHWPQNTERVEIFGTEGYMVLGRMGGGWQVFDRPKNRQPVVAAEAHGRFPDAPHQQNFIDSLRTGQRPAADIEDGHKSTLLCQYANISYRLGGRRLTVKAEDETLRDDAEAMALCKREYREPFVVPTEV